MIKKFEKIILFFLEPRVRTVLLIIIFGILIRLLVMPFSAHPDFMNATWREHLLSFHGAYKVNDLTEVVFAFYIKATRFFFNSNFERFLAGPDLAGDPSVVHYQAFVGKGVARYIFFLKVPYLLADLLALIFLFKIFVEEKRKWLIAAIWAFNPLVLYSVFIWGRYEIFPILFSLIALYLIKKEHFLWSMFFIGLAVAARMSFLLVLPFFLIYSYKNWRQLAVSLIVAVIPWFALDAVNRLMSQETVVAGIERGHLINYITTGQMGSSQTSISFFLILYPVAVYLFWRERDNLSFKKLNYFITLALLVFYVNARYNPQYFAWITPFLAASAIFNRKIIMPVVVMFLSFFLFVDSTWRSITTSGLFRPLNFDFFNHLNSIGDQKAFQMVSFTSLQVFFQSIFVLAAVWIAVILYRERNEID